MTLPLLPTAYGYAVYPTGLLFTCMIVRVTLALPTENTWRLLHTSVTSD